MKVHLLSALLFANTLLLGTSGCSKKQEDMPAPAPAPNTGSYVRDGVTVTCKANAALYSRSTVSQTIDVLNINLTDTSQPPSVGPIVVLLFEKPSSQPSSAYQLVDIGYVSPSLGVSYNNQVTTIQETGSKVFSGTFSGTALIQSQSAKSIISTGIFTNVSL